MSDQAGPGRLRWPLRLTTERRDGVLVVVASGRLSHRSAGALKAALDAAIDRDPGGLVLDCGLVDYVSSASLTVIEDASSRLAERGAMLVLCGVCSPVRIALELSGLLPGLPIEPASHAAVERVRAHVATMRPT